MLDFGALLTAEGLVSLVTLTALEIVLGVDNIVFIAVISARIDPARRSLLRRLGLALALGMRIGLLFALSWIMGLKRTLVSVAGQDFSGRDLILLGGGLFLMAKSAHEIYKASEHPGEAGHGEREGGRGARGGSFGLMLTQILILDVVFSLDSVITAVGMAREISIMLVAMVIAVGVMLLGANAISDFIHRHPSMKVLALSFLLMIGVLLVADGFGKHLSKGYVYFGMAYALGVEMIHMRGRRVARRKSARPG
jgi:predicted tellurium resistance membrane protein TerC